MKKIAIFGGSFNPVHNGHIRIATVAMKQLELDNVLFVPANIQPFKRETLPVSGEDRYNMLCLATAHEKKFCVSDFEIQNGGVSYSYITAEHFRDVYPGSKLYFIVGNDSYAGIDKWMNFDRLKKCVEFIVFPRVGKTFEGDALYIDIPPDNISSTKIRELILDGGDITKMVPKAVLDYINERGLYK